MMNLRSTPSVPDEKLIYQRSVPRSLMCTKARKPGQISEDLRRWKFDNREMYELSVSVLKR